LSAGTGIPLAGVRAGATRHDLKPRAAVLAAVVVAPAPTAPPQLARDRGDEGDDCRNEATARGSTPPIPPKASEPPPPPPPGHPERPPPRRWVVEVGHRRCHRFRRRPIRWANRRAHDLGFVPLAATRIISRKLRHLRLLSGSHRSGPLHKRL
jgi:hypothetical protein